MNELDYWTHFKMWFSFVNNFLRTDRGQGHFKGQQEAHND